MSVYLKQFTETANAGDVASRLVVAHILNVEPRIIGESACSVPNLIGIGSILAWADRNSVVWGTGIIVPKAVPREPPRAVLAVRGKLTREVLEGKGIACPPVYGDPGVFVPDLIQCSPKTETLGIVPHYADVNCAFVGRARASGIAIIDPTKPLDEFIYKLTSCERIISSSLHGLVFAHAYGIPAAWVAMSKNVIGNGFKFRDYYSSIDIATRNIPSFHARDRLSTIVEHCSLPAKSIDKGTLRDTLLAHRTLFEAQE